MRQLPNDKYTVAWFKLAEFVERGEKERALGLYKLLFHSFENKALAFQLEGDILLSFKDLQGAVERYTKAAELYLQEEKHVEAAAIHEHIILLVPSKYSFIILLSIYEQTVNSSRLLVIIDHFMDFLVQQQAYEELTKNTGFFEGLVGLKELLKSYQKIILQLCKVKDSPLSVIETLLAKVLSGTWQDDTGSLQTFLLNIKSLREDVYEKACESLKKE